MQDLCKVHVAVLIIAAGIQLDALPKHILSFYHSPTLQEHAEADDFLLQGGAPPQFCLLELDTVLAGPEFDISKPF